MTIFRKLRWKLTLSYTLVTVCAFLMVMLILGGIFFSGLFIPENYFYAPDLVDIIRRNSSPLWSHILSQSPVDTELIKMLLTEANATITGRDFLRIGALQFSVETVGSLRGYIIGADGIMYGTTDLGDPSYLSVGKKSFDPTRFQGLEAPYRSALAGVTDSSRLYTVPEENKRFIMALPLFNTTSGAENQVVGVIVVIFDYFPTQGDIPAHVLNIAARSLLIFLLGTGIMGALFGAFFANGLTTRFKRLSATTDAWSEGDFSIYIDDTTGDEISKFAQRLNDMAKQLQNLLRRRQDMAVSEERNRLARDLHDSAKQQALAASFQLGTALTLYERDPQTAKKHLVEADTLVDAVRKELANLIHELRPQSIDGPDFSEILKEYAVEWSHHSGIEMAVNIEGNEELSLESRETLFRIAQEALANVARHSSARCADLSLEYKTNSVILTIKDDGRGFDPSMQHGGLGLFSMRERAEETGGSFTVESAPDQGTQIIVTLPIANYVRRRYG